MKIISSLFLAIACSFFLFSCEHEQGITEDPAIGTMMKDSTGDCSPIMINGAYRTGQPLSVNTFITVHVNYMAIGVYDLRSDTVNGYYFRGVGQVLIGGDNTIRMQGYGTPISAGTDVLKIKSNGSECEANITVVSGTVSNAAFTFSSSSGNCTGAVMAGTYVQGTALTSSNTMTVQVNVTTPGAYSINTNNVNGISFSASGTFASAGPQTVSLAGSGTPVTAGVNNFAVSSAANTCTVAVTTTTAASGGNAVFTLGGSPGACTGAIVNGGYAVNRTLNYSNTISLQVNVTTPGAYSISTNTVNGFSFSKTGNFTATGVQNVVLDGTGVPLAIGTNNYTVNAGGSCTISVTTDPPGVFRCSIDGVPYDFSFALTSSLVYSGGGANFKIFGYSGAKTFSVWIINNTLNPLVPGTYHVDMPSPMYVLGNYTPTSGDYWIQETNGTTHPNRFTVVVSSVAVHRVQGTFQGNVKSMTTGASKVVTSGVFDVEY